MTPNHIQFLSDRERIYAQFHTGKITAYEAQRRLNALDDPERQLGWTIAALTGAVLLACVLIAVAELR